MRLLYPYHEELTGERAREVHTLHRVHALAQAGVKVSLVVAGDSHLQYPSILERFDLSSHPNLNIFMLPRHIRLGPLKITSTALFHRQLARWVQGQPPFDLAYMIHLKAAAFFQREFSKLPVVFEAHEIFADAHPVASSKYRALSDLERSVYSRCHALVATSNFLLGQIRDRYPVPQKTFVSPNGVDDRFFQVPISNPDPKRLVYIGSFQHWKGVDVAVDAMRNLPDFHLAVIGGSPEQVKKMRAMAPSNVELCGFQRRVAVLTHLERSGVGVLPNRFTPPNSLYTFPMKLLEYAASGREVVCVSLPVLKELELGTWAHEFQSENPDDFARAARSLVSGTHHGAEARIWAERFRWSRLTPPLRDFLKTVI